MNELPRAEAGLSPLWRQAVLLVMIIGFSLLALVTVKTYASAPPIPERVLAVDGELLFTGDDIRSGQEVFFQYALMEHGTLWGHGAYLGPGYTAEYLHRLAEIGRDSLARAGHGRAFAELPAGAALAVAETLKLQLKGNRYDLDTGTLVFSDAERQSWRIQQREWQDYFCGPLGAPGLPAHYLPDPALAARLNNYFAWATWATVADRPGLPYSYTNNWPYEPLVGNVPTSAAYLWSALSLVTLLGALGLILFLFGKFEFLGWGGAAGRRPLTASRMHGWTYTPSQRAIGLYLGVVMLLFLAQAALGDPLPDRGRGLELRRRRGLRLPDQPADRLLLRDGHHPHPEPRPRRHVRRVRHARPGGGGVLPARPGR
jgi:nitric oxide reductase subunit B